jgi:Ca2+-binding EF-hand superfamily protein
MKAFKYFDLNNNGTVEPDEFAKAIEKIGIMIPTQQVRLHIPGASWFSLLALFQPCFNIFA